MDDQKQQIVEKLKAANNILVTVSASPTVDQLSACIGLTLLLNKMGKHATAVFSGQVPSTIEFLKPEATIEKTTDSLRDFIIAIDKSKADKLRYKVEDEIVKIFITPYKSSISEKDLVFSQGDFNVDVVIGLGVHQQVDLDSAITAHGRILHDAVVISVNNTPNGDLGTIHWQNLSASGMSELVGSLGVALGDNLLDAQISTALLTGIVAETEHFGNKKTTPQTMTMSATLLAAGANQQLVSHELDEAARPKAPEAVAAKPADPDLLKISHTDAAKDVPNSDTTDKPATDPNLAVDSSLEELLQAADKAIENHTSAPVIELPKPAEPVETPQEELPHIGPAKGFGPNMDLPNAAPLSAPEEEPAKEPETPPIESVVPPVPSTPTPALEGDKTLSDIEAAVNSTHVDAAMPAPVSVPEMVAPTPVMPAEQPVAPSVTPPTDVNDARKAVEDALKQEAGNTAEPLEALNAVPVNLDLGHTPPAPEVVPQPGPGTEPDAIPDYLHTPSVVQPTIPPVPSGISMAPPQIVPPTSTTMPPQGPPPPPVPPPMPPANFGNPL